jgi:KTSC domain
MSYLPGKPEAPAATKPETIHVQSSFLMAATYDATNYSLSLEFKSGHSIVHRFVFPLVWTQFKEHPSQSSFYARSIKGKYPAVSFHTPLLVSHLEKAIKTHRGHALKSQWRHN